jgi:hypothetical protein
MTRKKELEEVKKILKENIEDAECGLFFTRNIVRDPMSNLFIGKFFTVDICRYWSYYEVFGCTGKEASELKDYYKGLNYDYSRRILKG